MAVMVWTKLDGTVDLAGSQALCTNLGSPYSSVVVDSDCLNVCIPLSSCMSVRVGYIVAGNLTLSANFTFSGHLPHLLSNVSGSVYAGCCRNNNFHLKICDLNSHEPYYIISRSTWQALFYLE